MDWDDLRLFLMLARLRRLGPVGAMVGQNATTVGRRIQRLEQSMQKTLFERTVAGYNLTSDGQALLINVEGMEREALGIAQGEGSEGLLTGTIRLSTAEGFGSHVLAPRLPTFTAAHPGVTVDLIASTGFLNPSRREADLAIMLSRPKAGPLIVRKLTTYRLGLYAHRRFIAERGEPHEVLDLLDRPLVGYVPDLVYAPELNYLADLDLRLKATIRSSSINAQAELVAAGAGFGVLPCFLAQRVPGLVRLLPQQASISRTFWLVVHRDVRQLARINRFLGWLDLAIRDAAISLAGSEPSLSASNSNL